MTVSMNRKEAAIVSGSRKTVTGTKAQPGSSNTELAGDLASGAVTIADSYVLRDEALRNYLNSLPTDAPIRVAHRFWKSLNTEGRLPTRQEIDPTEVDSATLPHIVLIDVEEEPMRRFRYRLVGTAVGKIFGADYSGRYLDEMGMGKVFDRVKALYSLVCAEPRPALLTGSYIAKSGAAFQVARLAMPLSDDGTRIDTLFCIFIRT